MFLQPDVGNVKIIRIERERRTAKIFTNGGKL
jgi:hypothetical protein